MGDTGPFSVNEKVLVPHTDKFYEAKVLKAQKREDGLWYYLLHYTGWNKKWDEWVEETGVRRTSASTQAANAAVGTPTAAGSIKAEPTAAAGAAAPASSMGNSSAVATVAGTVPSKGKQARPAGGTLQRQKRPGDAAAGTSETAEPQQHLEAELPAALKKQLLDQYDAIHDDQKIVPLPRRPNVVQILDKYVQYVRDKQGESQAEEDLGMGLKVYFDKALYQCLLYKGERQQAQRALAAGQAPSSVYGAEHLLRLFVKLPELLPQAGATEETMQLLFKRLEDLLAYIQHQQSKLFAPISDYVPVASQ